MAGIYAGMWHVVNEVVCDCSSAIVNVDSDGTVIDYSTVVDVVVGDNVVLVVEITAYDSAASDIIYFISDNSVAIAVYFNSVGADVFYEIVLERTVTNTIERYG